MAATLDPRMPMETAKEAAAVLLFLSSLSNRVALLVLPPRRRRRCYFKPTRSRNLSKRGYGRGEERRGDGETAARVGQFWSGWQAEPG
jgi:hypothetical protein